MKLGHRLKELAREIFAKTKPHPPAPRFVCGVSGASQQIYLDPGQTSGPGLARDWTASTVALLAFV